MGRPKTAGNRTKGGKKKKATTVAGRLEAGRILPTPETVAYLERRVEYWSHPEVWNRASAEQCFDNAGILWATGWFDKHGFQPDEIRNIFREYAGLYWQWYAGTAPKISRGERVGKSEPGIHKQGWEKKFMKLDGRLPLGSDERKAVHELAVDGWFFDEMHPKAVALSNLGRLRISARIKGASLPIAGEVAHDNGREADWLAAALRGAFMMLDATIAKEARRGWDIPLWALGNEDQEAA